MKSGDLREWVTLYRRMDGVPDAYGRVSAEYHKILDLPAAVSNVSSRDFFDAAAQGLQDVVTVTIRWTDDIDATCRVGHEGVLYDVLEVNHLGYRRDFMQLKCRCNHG